MLSRLDPGAARPLTQHEISQVLGAIAAGDTEPEIRQTAMLATASSFRSWCTPGDVDTAIRSLAR